MNKKLLAFQNGSVARSVERMSGLMAGSVMSLADEIQVTVAIHMFCRIKYTVDLKLYTNIREGSVSKMFRSRSCQCKTILFPGFRKRYPLVYPKSNRQLTGSEIHDIKTCSFPLNKITVKVPQCIKKKNMGQKCEVSYDLGFASSISSFPLTMC